MTTTNNTLPPPYNCPGCQNKALADGQEYQEIKDGFVYMGNVYHQNDYVLLRNQSEVMGPASVGRIIAFQRTLKMIKNTWRPWTEVTIDALGRMVDLGPPPEPMFIDEVSEVVI